MWLKILRQFLSHFSNSLVVRFRTSLYLKNSPNSSLFILGSLKWETQEAQSFQFLFTSSVYSVPLRQRRMSLWFIVVIFFSDEFSTEFLAKLRLRPTRRLTTESHRGNTESTEEIKTFSLCSSAKSSEFSVVKNSSNLSKFCYMKLHRDSSYLPLDPLFDIDLHRDLVADREFQTVYANAPDFVRELLLVDYFET